jgi:prepilin-type N-terminal cleavage/methylation domain-containing protein
MRGPRPLDARGFTLTEMLVALVVTGLAAAAVVGLLMDQNDFYRGQDQRLYAGAGVRAAAELVPMELRGLSGADVVTADADQLVVYHDVGQGFVCSVSGGIVRYYVFQAATADAGLPSGRGTAFSDPFDTDFVYDASFDATGSASSTAQSDCVDAGAPSGQPAVRYRSVSWTSGTGPPQRGAILRLFGTLTYSFGSSGFSGEPALLRNGTELVAPLETGSGSFRYQVCTAGTCNWHSSVTSASDRRDITRIEMNLTARGRPGDDSDVAWEIDHDVALRN